MYQIQNAGSISEGGGILDFKVGRHADLLYKTYLEIDFPEQSNSIYRIYKLY